MAKTDEEKAAFLRSVGGTHATWERIFDDVETLTSLTLAPLPAPPSPGPAARMKAFHESNTGGKTPQERAHEILFAASSVRPMMSPTATTPPSAVPRAVRAKEAAARRGENQG